LICDALQHGKHRVVFAQNVADRRGGVNAQGLKFAQQKQSENVIEIGVGQHHAGNRRPPHAIARMQLSRRFNLSP
jgi:hypothetical protein